MFCSQAFVYPYLDVRESLHCTSGAVIVGSVEGNRIWGEQLKGLSLYKITVSSFFVLSDPVSLTKAECTLCAYWLA